VFGLQVGTRGLHLTFNTGGISRMAHDPELVHLFEYFKRVRYLDANAWKLNLFFMDTDPDFTPDDGVFGIHHGAHLVCFQSSVGWVVMGALSLYVYLAISLLDNLSDLIVPPLSYAKSC
jgi:hypothetical protein